MCIGPRLVCASARGETLRGLARWPPDHPSVHSGAGAHKLICFRSLHCTHALLSSTLSQFGALCAAETLVRLVII